MTAPKTYVKKPVEIQAMQITGTAPNAHAVMGWLERNGYPFLIGNATEPETLRYPDQAEDDDSRPDKGIYINPADGAIVIRTLEGDMTARVDWWIIQGVQCEMYPCDPDIFSATYDEVSPE